MSTKIKVGFCVAYDWYLLKYSLPLVYNSADLICLSIDKQHISWANNPYDWDESGFLKMLKLIDTKNKITVLEDDFHLSNLSPMENEVRQRNLMGETMGDGGWHIQLDCDEYFLDFDKFVLYLKNFTFRKTAKINICCAWITLFKQTEDGFLFITSQNANTIEYIPIATNNPYYEYGRRNQNYNWYTNFNIVHQSWARTEKEIAEKLNNWGHRNDFDADQYLKFWRSLDTNNYKYFKNFHPIKPETWSSLSFCAGHTIENFIGNLAIPNFPLLSFHLWFKNNKEMRRIKFFVLNMVRFLKSKKVTLFL